MAERPILFNDEMVRAILSGRKTQTRRPVDMRRVSFIGGCEDDRDDPSLWGFVDIDGCWHVLDQRKPAWFGSGVPHESYALACPLGAPGDRLWVRECFAANVPGCSRGLSYRADHVDPRGDGPAHPMRWTPSIHMPRWASRLTLRVTGIRVERVQDISEEDARAEGFTGTLGYVVDAKGNHRPDLTGNARGAFLVAWDSIYGKHDPSTPESVTQNPWVWAISFEKENAT